MMNKSKIDWTDFTWNPVTGCTFGCAYCYARKQAGRFSGDIRLNKRSRQITSDRPGQYILNQPFKNNKGTVTPFPVGFEPTFHKYRLPMPAEKKKPANIFVCSMADLFSPAMPTRWIVEVFDACLAAPQHNYIFLTKYPQRYGQLEHVALLPHQDNFWYGTTITRNGELDRIGHLPLDVNRFISIEPILEPIDLDSRPQRAAIPFADWIIVGAETGNQKTRTAPQREWIEAIAQEAQAAGIPLFMKSSDELAAVWGLPLTQELPEGLDRPDIPVPHCEGCKHHTAELRHHNRVRGDVYIHTCGAVGAPRTVPGRYARTSPPWCPKREEAAK